MAFSQPRDLSFAARLGIWLGAGAWLVGFACITAPDSFRFMPALAGGVLVTLAGAILLDSLASRAPRYLAGASCLVVVAIGLYWGMSVAPAVEARPEVLARLESLGVSAEFPPHVTFTVAAVGCLLLLRAWRRTPAKAQTRD